MAASQGFKTDSEQSSDDGRANSSYLLSPPSSNGSMDKVYPCAADSCIQVYLSLFCQFCCQAASQSG